MSSDISPLAGSAIARLRDPATIRERAEMVLRHVEDGQSPHFALDANGLENAVRLTLAVIHERFPDPRKVPFHARWRHFEVGGRDRWAALAGTLRGAGKAERARIRVELAITSVLLDAGAGADWGYREPDGGARYARSEGLAVASFDLYRRGGFSNDPASPLRADAEALRRFGAPDLAMAFQVFPHNPLVGLAGRAELIASVGGVVAARPDLFGAGARLGNLFDHLASQAKDGALPAALIFATLLDAFSPIWPSRLDIEGVALGDVWKHPAARARDRTDGLVPFHKLSQWLTYSLVEPLEEAGIRIVDLDALTGLPEYRNGGLLIDSGALRVKRRETLERAWAPGDEVIVEWRALTVALLDRIGAHVRLHLGLDAQTLPLVKVLEGGTWLAGRRIAAERRPGGAPPIAIDSDGTVF
ncbi:MAG: URC4/urg3 family protein [Alphaproteobacteria bacterium]|nr:URC4/urg3 family protein [Alphaproteobacteria bacterium]MCW5738929.1 URC4/urg3 family protein [Alphaproteobacteria bacterium]